MAGVLLAAGEVEVVNNMEERVNGLAALKLERGVAGPTTILETVMGVVTADVDGGPVFLARSTEDDVVFTGLAAGITTDLGTPAGTFTVTVGDADLVELGITSNCVDGVLVVETVLAVTAVGVKAGGVETGLVGLALVSLSVFWIFCLV